MDQWNKKENEDNQEFSEVKVQGYADYIAKYRGEFLPLVTRKLAKSDGAFVVLIEHDEHGNGVATKAYGSIPAHPDLVEDVQKLFGVFTRKMREEVLKSFFEVNENKADALKEVNDHLRTIQKNDDKFRKKMGLAIKKIIDDQFEGDHGAMVDDLVALIEDDDSLSPQDKKVLLEGTQAMRDMLGFKGRLDDLFDKLAGGSKDDPTE